MATVKQLLEVAESQLGVCENPPESNRVKYNTWYYGWEVHGSGYPWCMVFIQWVFDKAGVKLPARTASCTALMNAGERLGRVFKTTYKVGDIVFLDFKSSGTPQHCGIIERVNATTITTIEGNTSPANDANGGTVARRERRNNQVVAVYRPVFEEDKPMTIDRLIDEMTDEHAYEILKKAQRHADSLPAPSWVTKEGYWSELLKMGVINTNTPESLVKRDELASILGRLGLISDAE